jgi:hypothetical protein
VRQQVLRQLVLEAEDLGAEGARVVAALVVRRRQVLLQPVAVVEHLQTVEFGQQQQITTTTIRRQTQTRISSDNESKNFVSDQ